MMTATNGTELTGKQKGAIMGGLMLGLLLASLDQTVVGTAMPRVIAHLGGMSLYAWVFTAYMLASTASVPIFGKLSDLFGRKSFYLGGLIVFMVGSALAGAAQTMNQLVAFRGLQGVGAGILFTNAIAIIGDVFPPAERGRYQGLMGAVFGLSSVIGPLVGGYITDSLNWRWVFYVNLPVGILAVLVFAWAMPSVRASGVKRPIDYFGVATLLLATVPMLLAFSWAGKEYAWGSARIVGLLIFSGLAWIAFLVAESRAQEPILPLDLFRNGIFTVSTIVVFLTGFGMFGAIAFVPLFMQGVIGVSATNSGLLLTPMMLGTVVSSTIAGQVMSRSGKYKAMSIAGLIVLTLGSYLLASMTEATTYTRAIVYLVLTGLGLGVTFPVFTLTVQNALPYNRLGVVSAAVQFFRSIGGTIGVAILGSILSTRLAKELAAAIPETVRQTVPAEQLSRLTDPQVLVNPDALRAIQEQAPPGFTAVVQQLMAGLKHALAASIHEVFLFGTIVLGLSIIVCFWLKEIPLRQGSGMRPALASEAGGIGETLEAVPEK